MKGICFKEPLFHATVRGSKTQTRRIMKPQPDDGQIWNSILGLEMKPRYKKGELLTINLHKMTVEEYFEEWWTSKELPKNGFNKTAMLDFAEMYHNQALRKHDVVGRSEQLESGLTCMMCRKPKQNDGHTCCEECAGLAF